MERQRIYRVVQRSPNPNGPDDFQISTLCFTHAVAMELIHARMGEHSDWRVFDSIDGGAAWIRRDGYEKIYLIPETILV